MQFTGHCCLLLCLQYFLCRLSYFYLIDILVALNRCYSRLLLKASIEKLETLMLNFSGKIVNAA